MNRIRVRYLLNGFETEYLEDVVRKLLKKELVEIVAPKQAKPKKSSEEKPKAAE